jgi:hypothetical protein
MYKVKVFFTIAFCLLISIIPAATLKAQQIRINEIMSSNLNLFPDEYGMFEDWIELYNGGDQTVNLEGYGLSDDYTHPFKWVFPSWELEPGEFLKVWASGKNLIPDKGAWSNGIMRLFYSGIAGSSVNDLVNHPNFPDNPTSRNIILNSFEAPTNIADNYGQHLYTWLVPPMTGEYTFWIASDDNSQLYLSTDETIENAQLIAEVPGWANPRTFTKYPQQRSAKIHLEEGKKYYLSALMKEGYGGDNLSVRWQLPDGTVQTPLPAIYCFLSEKRMHTNFSISSSGEEVILTHPDGTLLDSVPPLPIPANISYGRQPDGSDNWYFFGSSTPGFSNNSTGFEEISQKPAITPAGGVYSGPIWVSLETEDQDAVIYYTLDGKNPDQINGSVYSGPLEINNTVYLRTIAISPGMLPGEVAAATYSIADQETSSFNSNLPLMVIHQFDTLISSSQRTTAYMFLLGDESGSRVDLLSEPGFAGRININIRGSSSQSFPKKGFGFHTFEENGSNRKVSLLGMPEEHNWILHGPYSDKSLMRNAVAYSLSNDIGQYAPRSRFVELFLHDGNGMLEKKHYHGVYLLVERIKDAPGRIEIDRVEPHQNEYPEITGGYIFKKDRLNPGESGFRTPRGSLYAHVRPDEQTITTEQQQYLISYVDSIEKVLFSAQFNDPHKGYRSFLDVESFIDYHLLTELCKEIDGYRLSTFFYKDRKGKLILGPLWDYNLSLGNADYNRGWDPVGWYYPLISTYDYLNGWYNRLFLDPGFREQYNHRYRKLRQTQFSEQFLFAKVNNFYSQLEEAQARNFERWPVLGQHVWPNWYIAKTFEEEVSWMKDWIRKRLEWMDSQLGAPYVLIHYWNFNAESVELTPTFTYTEASIEIEPGLQTEVITGTGQGFAGLNARFQDQAGQHLRVNNPIGTEMIFRMSSVNFKNLIFSYETRRSTNGANRQFISYSIDGETFIETDTVIVTDHPRLYSFNFGKIEGANNNPLFAVRVIIDHDQNDDAGGMSGNNRFDNVTLDGEVMDGANIPPIQIVPFPQPFEMIENGVPLSINLSSYFSDPNNDVLQYTATPEIPGLANIQIQSGQMVIEALNRGGTYVNLSISDGVNDPIESFLYLLVYPEAAVFKGSDFIFDFWSPNEPEGSFPDQMLFVQSNTDDPDIETFLGFAYTIPIDDYAEGDSQNIGFPYRNENRTRINGLGANGISFINTGRGRDLGAAILALNTTGLDSVSLAWQASTIRVNSRVYRITLQYRIGLNYPWHTWTNHTGDPVQYNRHEIQGHSQLFTNIPFPEELLNQPYIQLRWFYHYTGEHLDENIGARDMLALNRIMVEDLTEPTSIVVIPHPRSLLVYPNPAKGDIININKTATGIIYDIAGNAIGRIEKSDTINISGYRSGLYILRTDEGEVARFIVTRS